MKNNIDHVLHKSLTFNSLKIELLFRLAFNPEKLID